MGDVLQVQQEALVDFARFAWAKHDDLEPWTGAHYKNFVPEPGAFGAITGSTEDIEYEYMPLTIEEFEKERNVTLDPEYDPGPEVVQDLGSGWTGALAWIADSGGFLGLVPGIIDLFSDDDRTDKVANWLDYYACRGPDTATFVYLEGPTDAPWASKLHTDWTTAVDNRLSEVDEIRREIEYVIPLLAVAAEKYADTDLYGAAEIDATLTPDQLVNSNDSETGN